MFAAAVRKRRKLSGPMKKDSVGYWNKVAGTMRRREFHLDPALGRIKREAYLALLNRWALSQRRGRVLKTDLFEEAFGTDALLPDLAAEAREVVGIDLAPRTADHAWQRHGAAQAAFLGADVRRLPFRDESFDLILSPSTLDHFPDPTDLGRSLRELCRVLKPEGRLVITLDNRQNIFYPLLRLADRLGRIPFYLGSFYTIGEMARELENAGFHVVGRTAIVHNPRLLAVGSVMMARALRWDGFHRAIQRLWQGAQRLERSCWRYRTGTFLACAAEKVRP